MNFDINSLKQSFVLEYYFECIIAARIGSRFINLYLTLRDWETSLLFKEAAMMVLGFDSIWKL